MTELKKKQIKSFTFDIPSPFEEIKNEGYKVWLFVLRCLDVTFCLLVKSADTRLMVLWAESNEDNFRHNTGVSEVTET